MLLSLSSAVAGTIPSLPIRLRCNRESPDAGSATYPYPEFALSPEGWSAITTFVAHSVTRRTIDDGILQAAENRAQIFVTDLLQQAGFAAVTFVR